MTGPLQSGGSAPYKRTPIFHDTTLPAGLRRQHRTKTGVWCVIRVLDSRLRYRVLDRASEDVLEPGHPGLVLRDHVAVPIPVTTKTAVAIPVPALPISVEAARRPRLRHRWT